MTRSILCFLILVFFISYIVDGRSREGSRSYRGFGGESYSRSQKKRSESETNKEIASASTRKSTGGGLGAWGYVAIILTVIFAGVGAYYFALFYPLLCKKERKYDMMQMQSL